LPIAGWNTFGNNMVFNDAQNFAFNVRQHVAALPSSPLGCLQGEMVCFGSYRTFVLIRRHK
ncbi:hypothetical protein, partial [Caldalkalibacillus thermarum]|uniref:hypothetical protein n=1 Tax=Caldalkalibacillus thermarum TaxID=296745 RepID=UPI001ED92405